MRLYEKIVEEDSEKTTKRYRILDLTLFEKSIDYRGKEYRCLNIPVYRKRNKNNPFMGTGFENPENYIRLHPIRKLNIQSKRICIHIHLFHIFLSDEFFLCLSDFPVKFDLIITIVDSAHVSKLQYIFHQSKVPNLDKLTIKVVPNRGRDIAPWLLFTKDEQYCYDLFCHIHSKTSNHVSFGNEWRRYLLKNLISKEAVFEILHLFSDENIGCLFPDTYPALRRHLIKNNVNIVGSLKEKEIINDLLMKMNIKKGFIKHNLFFSMGTMFWYRPDALNPLFSLNLELDDFPPEPIGLDGTIAHAIERLPAIVCNENGYKSAFYTRYES